ncbi:hypothetical protein MNBD_GAMMA07-1096 [hydrothermal vent metagenome]|uniref:DUF6795 domain-containing protein n=1 Tax=hydrothermal vent metagenome TaxID=652676 RepID=A0A3B0XIC1_9ZZZZ
MVKLSIKNISNNSFWLLTTLVLVSFSLEGASMSLFSSKKEIVLSSPLEGILTYEGKPLPNVKIERKLSWYDGEGEAVDFVVTDEKGYFNLPFVKKELKVGLTQLVILQKIYAKYKNEDALVWHMAKLTDSEYSELGGKPVNLHCDLAIDYWINREPATVTTRCKWDSIEKIGNTK